MEKSLPIPKNFSLSLLRSETARRLLAFGALIILIIAFSLLSENFLRFNNVIGIFIATAVNGVLALGVTFVIITGGIDLSIGTVMTFSAVMTGMFIAKWDMPIAVGVMGGILTGTLAGFTNGVLISWMRVPPFVATLGMMYVAKGLSLILSELRPIYFYDTPLFREIAMGNHFNIFGQSFDITYRGYDIPNAIWILFAAAIVGSFLLSKTILGRYTFALGSNAEATRLSGVKVNIWKTAVYTVCGTFAGLGGVLMASRLNSAQPALGQGYELDAIAAVVIGGTALTGGEGTILGTIIGAFVMSVLANGLRILSVPQEWQIVVTGAILVVVVYIDIVRRRQ
ncbi:MAG: ABC transporter permease [Chloroflexi bacterium]|nr:ABC transporter permease [Chloroflexota bacterium]